MKQALTDVQSVAGAEPVIVCRSAAELEKMRAAGAGRRGAGCTLEGCGSRCDDCRSGRRRRRLDSGCRSDARVQGYHGYPATICASVNDEVIHGIPSGKRVLKATSFQLTSALH